MAAATIYPAFLSFSGRIGTTTGLPHCDPTRLQQIHHSEPQRRSLVTLLGCHVLSLGCRNSAPDLSGCTWAQCYMLILLRHRYSLYFWIIHYSMCAMYRQQLSLTGCSRVSLSLSVKALVTFTASNILQRDGVWGRSIFITRRARRFNSRHSSQVHEPLKADIRNRDGGHCLHWSSSSMWGL